MNCGNSMIASFSGWSRSARGLLNTRAPIALGLLQQVGGVEVLAVEGRVLAHQHGVEVRFSGAARAPAHLEPSVRVAGEFDVAHMAPAPAHPRCHITSCGSQAADACGRARWPRASWRRWCPCRS
jgi:hypothetical protein